MGSDFDNELMDEGYDGIDDTDKYEIKVKGTDGETETLISVKICLSRI